MVDHRPGLSSSRAYLLINSFKTSNNNNNNNNSSSNSNDRNGPLWWRFQFKEVPTGSESFETKTFNWCFAAIKLLDETISRQSFFHSCSGHDAIKQLTLLFFNLNCWLLNSLSQLSIFSASPFLESANTGPIFDRWGKFLFHSAREEWKHLDGARIKPGSSRSTSDRSNHCANALGQNDNDCNSNYKLSLPIQIEDPNWN